MQAQSSKITQLLVAWSEGDADPEFAGGWAELAQAYVWFQKFMTRMKQQWEQYKTML